MDRTDTYRSMAARCYRLASVCTDRCMTDALLDYAGECEAKAGLMDGATFAGLLPSAPQRPATEAGGARQSVPRNV